MKKFRASLVAQWVKQLQLSLPAMQETWVQSLIQEDPLEKEMATHSCKGDNEACSLVIVRL